MAYDVFSHRLSEVFMRRGQSQTNKFYLSLPLDTQTSIGFVFIRRGQSRTAPSSQIHLLDVQPIVLTKEDKLTLSKKADLSNSAIERVPQKTTT
jgi:hypothetical protein